MECAEDRCRILLSRGVPDPLALMTFKILPNDRPDDEAFARQPIGSGLIEGACKQLIGRRMKQMELAAAMV